MKNHLPMLFAGCALLASGLAVTAYADTGNVVPKVDKSQPTPVIYPMMAQRGGEEGAVDVYVLIDARGHATGRYKILGTSGHDDLDQAAVQSVMNWNYIPAHDAGGDTQQGWVRLHVDYKLPPQQKQAKD